MFLIGKSNHRNQHGAFHLGSLHKSLDQKENLNIKKSITKDNYESLKSSLIDYSYQNDPEVRYRKRNQEVFQDIENKIARTKQVYMSKDDPSIQSKKKKKAKNTTQNNQTENMPSIHKENTHKSRSQQKPATPFQNSCQFFCEGICSITNQSCKQHHSCLFYKKSV